MIVGTNANCKILSIHTYNSTATIKCLIYSNSSTPESQGFKFYFKDLNGDYHSLSNNIYWIDRYINYDNQATNVDTNKYKEIILNVDITNNFSSELEENRWIRTGQIVLINQKNTLKTPAWGSEMLTLISEGFEIPDIKNLSMFSDEQNHLQIAFEYSFTSQENFNYNSNNFYTEINIISLKTNKVLEDIIIENKDVVNFKVLSTSLQTYSEPIMVELFIRNKQKDILKHYSRVYKPFKKVSSTYMKDSTGVIRKVILYSVALSNDTQTFRDQETPSTFLVRNREINSVPRSTYKVNYNNASVKILKLDRIDYAYLEDKIVIAVPNAEQFDEVLLDAWINNTHVATNLDVTHSEVYINCDGFEFPMNLLIQLTSTTSFKTTTTSFTTVILDGSLTISPILTVTEDLTIKDKQ